MASGYVPFHGSDDLGLYLVSSPPSRIRPTCDIIFLHGLNGGPSKTWRHPETNKIWIQDYLPSDLLDQEKGLNARIWTYGYNANAAFRAAAGASAFDFAHQLLERVAHIREGHETLKILWICHSLGGIVVKTALIEARLNLRYTSILDSTKGILFLGTPHQGSGVANIADVAATIGSVMLPGVLLMANQPLIRSLKKDCDYLFERAGQFANISSGIQIYNVYEMLPMGGRLIVQRRSALMNLPGEVQIPLNATHRTLCKFHSDNDHNYIVLRDTIRKMVVLTVPSHQPGAPPRPVPRGQPRPSPAYSFQRQPESHTAGWQAFTSRAPQKPPYPSETTPPASGNRSGSSPHPSAAMPSPPATPTTSPPVPPKRPISQTHAPQQDRSRAASATQRSRPQVSEPAVPTINDVSSAQPPAQEPSRPVSAGPTSRSTPYTYRPTNSTEDLSSRFKAWQPLNNNGTSKYSSSLSPNDATKTRNNGPAPASTKLAADSQPASEATGSNWICDNGMHPIPMDSARVHCLDCDDYDLCKPCFNTGTATKGHKRTHKVQHIVRSICFAQAAADLVPPGDLVHPQTSTGKTQANWSVEGDIRWHHLLEHNGHARFLGPTIEPGHYAVSFIIQFRFSKKLGQEHYDQLKDDGFGKLRLAAGIINTRQQFFKERFLENELLINKLYNSSVYNDFKIKPQETGKFELRDVFHVESKPSGKLDVLGLMMQWTDVRSFASSEDPIVDISLVEVRLEDLLDFDIPSPPPPATPSAASTGSAPRSPTAPPAQPASSADADADGITYADLYQAILDAAREEQSKQEVEAFQAALVQELRRQQQAQLRAQEAAEARALQERVAAALEKQRQVDNYAALTQLGLLQSYLNSALKQ